MFRCTSGTVTFRTVNAAKLRLLHGRVKRSTRSVRRLRKMRLRVSRTVTTQIKLKQAQVKRQLSEEACCLDHARHDGPYQRNLRRTLDKP